MKKQQRIATLVGAFLISESAFATNGFSLDSYGPISGSMGGTSMAYENGGASMINNPATLGLMSNNSSRFELGVGNLMPQVKSNDQQSDVKNILVPEVAYTRKDGDIAWGAGVLLQGGVGTEYSDGRFLGTMAGYGTGNDTSGQSLRNRAELGVGRIVFPMSYSVNEDFNIGGSIDYVWAGMDLQWLVDGAHFHDMISPSLTGGASTQTFGKVSGTLVNTLVGSMGGGAGQISGLSWGYLNFNKSGQFSQAATASGLAGNLGFTYKITPALTIGGVYHAKTKLSDLTAGSAQFTVNAAINSPAATNTNIPISGKVTIKDFQWPETFGFGLSYVANDSWQLAVDYKRINWSDVMKDFNIVFEAGAGQANAVAASLVGGGKTLNIDYHQNWKNQDILQLGAAYKYSSTLVLRFGASIANNPIPNATVSPLFPVIFKEHYMAGFGYTFDKNNKIDGSVMYAPKVKVTNHWSSVGGSDQTISAGGASYMMTYTNKF